MTEAPGTRRDRRTGRGRHLPRAWTVACLVLLTLLGGLAGIVAASPASAHATLVGTDPEEGEVLTSAPDTVTFTFDEPVTLTSGSVQVFDASGSPVEATSTSRDTVISTDLPDTLDDGTYVVLWRAVSADGHPIAGSLSFAVGAPSLAVAAPAVPDTDGDAVRTLLSASQALVYVGLLTAGGLVVFLCWTAAGVRLDPRVRRRLQRVLLGASLLAVTAGALVVVLAGAYQQGVGLGGVAWTPDLSLVGDDLLVLALQVIGLGVAVSLVQARPGPLGSGTGAVAALAAASVAVVAPALVGHSRATEPVWLISLTDALHLLVASTWLGGLVALAITLPSLSGRARDGATVLARFSGLAAGLLVVLTISGVPMGSRILGGWTPLVDTAYGRVLLVKVAVAAVVVLVAGWNRWRLLPRVRHAVGHGAERRAVAGVARAVRVEAALLVLVVGLTGFLVNLSPREAEAAQRPAVASRVAAAELGESRVLATLTPGRTGPNTLSIQVQDADQEPRDGFAAPVVSIRSEGGSAPLDLGATPLSPSAVGTYTADVVLPTAGTWVVQVSLRASEFDNPVTTIRFEVDR